MARKTRPPLTEEQKDETSLRMRSWWLRNTYKPREHWYERIRQILEMRAKGKTSGQIALRFGISAGRVGQILRRETLRREALRNANN